MVRILQLDSSTNTAVNGTYMVHLMCQSIATTAKQDLEGVVNLLCTDQELHVLQSLYFNLDLCSVGGSSPLLNKLSNLYLTSDPDPTMTYEVAVLEAETIFKGLCPDVDLFDPFLN